MDTLQLQRTPLPFGAERNQSRLERLWVSNSDKSRSVAELLVRQVGDFFIHLLRGRGAVLFFVTKQALTSRFAGQLEFVLKLPVLGRDRNPKHVPIPELFCTRIATRVLRA